jgi:hypothetical protein
MRALSVWMEGDHSFTSIFPFSEFTKLMIGDGKPDTCKIVFFDGI